LALLERIRCPAGKLLQAEQTSGLVRFPVVLRVNAKLSDHLIKLCTCQAVGYNLYIVFGGYVAIDNALALGIRQDVATRQTDHGDLQLDITRFSEKLPQMSDRFPELAPVVKELQPVQPARINRQHYYTLLLPRGTIGESRHVIGDWTFLTA
jgi:hypothetical protein